MPLSSARQLHHSCRSCPSSSESSSGCITRPEPAHFHAEHAGQQAKFSFDGEAVARRATIDIRVRVPLNTQPPLTFPATLSTTRHGDPSSEAISIPSVCVELTGSQTSDHAAPARTLSGPRLTVAPIRTRRQATGSSPIEERRSRVARNAWATDSEVGDIGALIRSLYGFHACGQATKFGARRNGEAQLTRNDVAIRHARALAHNALTCPLKIAPSADTRSTEGTARQAHRTG
jgi:hypothetical protein